MCVERKPSRAVVMLHRSKHSAAWNGVCLTMFGLCPHTVEKINRTVCISVFFGALWLASVGFGMRVLLKYDNTPGRSAEVTESFPAESALFLASDRPTLVMLAHPRCPCTRASVGELAKIMAELQGKVKAYVLFTKPVGSDAAWNDTGLWRSVAEIPGDAGRR